MERLNHQKTIIFYAPPGWGKSTRAETLKAQYGCGQIIDEWRPGQPITAGGLHLTNVAPSDAEAAQLAETGVRVVYMHRATPDEQAERAAP